MHRRHLAHGLHATIPRRSYPVFMALLEHLYTDVVDDSHDLSLPLLAAADFFVRFLRSSNIRPLIGTLPCCHAPLQGVDHLKSVCADRIEAGLAVENVCEALTVRACARSVV